METNLAGRGESVTIRTGKQIRIVVSQSPVAVSTGQKHGHDGGTGGRKDSSFVGKLPDAMQCSKDFSVIVMDWWRRRLTSTAQSSSTLCPLYSILSLHEDPVSIVALLLMRRSAGVGLAVVT